MPINKKKIAGEKATEYIKDGMTVGLGTGSTAKYLVEKVGEMVKNGLKIQAVATSRATENMAKELGITLIDVNDVDYIDVAIDGVDEIDRDFNATKGGGGALFREKIVASLAKKVIWIMDDSKLVESIGEFPLPVEILPYGYKATFKRLKALGYNPVMRLKNNELYKYHDKRSIGYKDNEDANPEDMFMYYSQDMIKKYGVIGIGLSVVEAD